MKRTLLIAGLCLGMALPASAQMMEKKRMPMVAPSMEQCEGGYRRSYKKTMHLRRSKFKASCRGMMMKKGKM